MALFGSLSLSHAVPQPWSYHIDLISVGQIVHTLLHGNELQVQFDGSAKLFRPSNPTRTSGLDSAFWERFFEPLLNTSRSLGGGCGGEVSSVALLGDLRNKVEAQLAASGKGKNLKSMLLKQTIALHGDA
jgi:hypothetical protein